MKTSKKSSSPKPNTPKKAEQTKRTRPGQPTKYKPEYADLAYKVCLLGATNDELATFFEVATSTIDKWIAEIPEFSGAVRAGKTTADATIAHSLYHRGKGYSHQATKMALDRHGNWRTMEYTEHYPPDAGAAQFWLKNRQPDKWRDKQELDLNKTITVIVEGEDDEEEQ